MREQLERRVKALRDEFELGQARLRELDAQQVRLRETLLRISGAIQALEEVLATAPANGPTEAQGSAAADGQPVESSPSG